LSMTKHASPSSSLCCMNCWDQGLCAHMKFTKMMNSNKSSIPIFSDHSVNMPQFINELLCRECSFIRILMIYIDLWCLSAPSGSPEIYFYYQLSFFFSHLALLRHTIWHTIWLESTCVYLKDGQVSSLNPQHALLLHKKSGLERIL